MATSEVRQPLQKNALSLVISLLSISILEIGHFNMSQMEITCLLARSQVPGFIFLPQD